MSRERLLSEVWGYSFDPDRTLSTSACGAYERNSGRLRRSRPCGMRVTAWLLLRAARWTSRGPRLPSRASAVMIAFPAWETIPFHVDLDQPDDPVRVPGLVDLDDIGRPGRRGDRYRRLDHDRRLRRAPALGRAVRGSPDVGDVPRDGLARETPRRSPRDRQGPGRRARVLARSGRAAAARRLTRAPNPGHHCARPPRAARRRLGEEQPELTVAFDELQRIERIVDRLLLLARVERPDFVDPAQGALCRFSRTCSCAGPRSPRAPGVSARSST